MIPLRLIKIGQLSPPRRFAGARRAHAEHLFAINWQLWTMYHWLWTALWVWSFYNLYAYANDVAYCTVRVSKRLVGVAIERISDALFISVVCYLL